MADVERTKSEPERIIGLLRTHRVLSYVESDLLADYIESLQAELHEAKAYGERLKTELQRHASDSECQLGATW